MHAAEDASGEPCSAHSDRERTVHRLLKASVSVVVRSVDIHLGAIMRAGLTFLLRANAGCQIIHAHRVTSRSKLAGSVYNKTFSPAQAQIRVAKGHCQAARHDGALPAVGCTCFKKNMCNLLTSCQ